MLLHMVLICVHLRTKSMAVCVYKSQHTIKTFKMRKTRMSITRKEINRIEGREENKKKCETTNY